MQPTSWWTVQPLAHQWVATRERQHPSQQQHQHQEEKKEGHGTWVNAQGQQQVYMRWQRQYWDRCTLHMRRRTSQQQLLGPPACCRHHHHTLYASQPLVACNTTQGLGPAS
jgi:hypothetical protein